MPQREKPIINFRSMRRECGSDFRSRGVYKKAIPGLQGGTLAGFRDSFQRLGRDRVGFQQAVRARLPNGRVTGACDPKSTSSTGQC
jgi:hypothetical protein